jgi:hypothetical protein
MSGYVSYAIFTLTIFFNTIVLYWLLKLEDMRCVCALNWRRTYIMWYLLFSIVIATSLVLGLRGPNMSSYIIEFIIIVTSIINAFISLQYVYKLRKDKCVCSEHIASEILYITSLLQGFIYGVLLCLGSITVLIMITSIKSIFIKSIS